jgi:quercetin dioxygenase-like cupin family protein
MKGSAMKQPDSTRKKLRPGQTMHFHAERGLIVVAVRGEIRFTIGPTLAGELAMRQAIVLHEGEAHVMREDGWLAVSAQLPAEVACIAKETWTESMWRRCLGMLAGYRRRWRSLVA